MSSYLSALLEEFRGSNPGEVATYIPDLGRADPEWFSICICTTDGHVYAVGDAAVEFTIQSVSKPFVFGAALESHGRDAVLQRVGVEPSGNPFNAIIVDESSRPFNPMVNAGAIVTTAMLETDLRIVDCLSRYAGRDLSVDEAVYESERATGDRNRAIAFLMSSFGVIDVDPDAAVDRYFRQCSVSVTCRDLAVMAATLANRGRNPVTGDVAVAEPCVESVLSVMSTCGMYDASGEWMYRIGLPSKSGVSGGVLAVLPGQFGIGVFSPRLDANGNSNRGIKVCERVAADFDLHPMRFQPAVAGVVRRTYTCAEVRSNRVRPGAEVELLVEHGDSARVFELQGELFVGTTERVFRHVVATVDEVEIAILDCKRVTRVDASSRLMIEEMRVALAEAGCELVIADAEGGPDVDVALERCEDRILERLGVSATGVPSGLAGQELLGALDEGELTALTALTCTHTLGAGEVLFKHGDPADSVFFISSGALTVQLPAGDVDGDGVPAAPRRLARLGAGVCVGEMALVGDSVRSADVVVSQDCALIELPTAALAALHASQPDLAAHLYSGLAKVLADRLRRANEQLLLVG